jgi:diketogulonate reductase-like aldo/keto reductase
MPAGRAERVLSSVQQSLAPTPQQPAATAATAAAADAGALPEFRLRSSGLLLPAIGLGCGYNPTEQAERGRTMLDTALECGYRHLDTAQRYGTEPAVGAALAARFSSGTLSRDDVWVTTKVANPRPAFPGSGMQVGGGIRYMLRRDMDAYTGLLEEFAGCLASLELRHVDLLLMHYPGQPPEDEPLPEGFLTTEEGQAKRLAAWRAMERIKADGQARAVGVSNYARRHLEEIEAAGMQLPEVNQIELHPRLPQTELVEYCHARGIVVTAYSPLNGADLDSPTLIAIAEKYGVSAASVVLRWLLERGCAVLPMSMTPARVRDNLASPASFSLSTRY